MTLQEIYQEVVLDHCRNPKNYGIKKTTHQHTIDNPLCGDQVTIGILVEDGQISQISFVCECCAICKASASIMTEVVKGQSLKQVPDLYKSVYLLFAKGEDSTETPEMLAPLKVVAEWPNRVKCAMLPWNGVLKLVLMVG